jgi:hypothetical protein
MFHVTLHHDVGWAEFNRNPVTDEAAGLPYNLVETPAEYITVTSRQRRDRSFPSWALLQDDLGDVGRSRIHIANK